MLDWFVSCIFLLVGLLTRLQLVPIPLAGVSVIPILIHTLGEHVESSLALAEGRGLLLLLLDLGGCSRGGRSISFAGGTAAGEEGADCMANGGAYCNAGSRASHLAK